MTVPAKVLQMATLEKPAYQWPEPEPLTEQTSATAFPMDALPGIIGGAIREVVEIVKCPTALAVNSVLSVLAVAGQGVANIKPYADLANPSPLSLYSIIIGMSGERKTSADNFFSEVLNKWCAAKMEEIEPELKKYKADMTRWEAEKRGLERRIEEASKKGDNEAVDVAHKRLILLEREEPEKVYSPDMLMEDTTPEAVAFDLVNKWPAGGVLSSEAGVVFGGHGMKSDNIAKNLATLNKLWEGGQIKITRRTSESFTVSGARLSVGLAVQPEIIRKYHEQNGAAARGSGFFARFLLAWPESTIGTRFISVEEARGGLHSKNQLNLFYARLHEILERHYENAKVGKGKLDNLPTLPLSPDALKTWVAYLNSVEEASARGGDMEEAKDIASKSADNAARLAGLLHLFNGGHVLDAISGETMTAACKLAIWYLYEARRFFGEIALPVEDLDAVKLDSWLIAECKATGSNAIGKTHTLQRSNLRKADKLNKALDTLERANRIRQVKEGRMAVIEINPALLKG